MVRIINLYDGVRVAMENGRGEVLRLVNLDSGTEKIDLHLNRLAPGAQRGRMHKHSQSDNVYIIRSGTAELRTGNEVHQLVPDQIVHIPAGVEHSLSNVSQEMCELFEIYAPAGKSFDVVPCD